MQNTERYTDRDMTAFVPTPGHISALEGGMSVDRNEVTLDNWAPVIAEKYTDLNKLDGVSRTVLFAMYLFDDGPTRSEYVKRMTGYTPLAEIMESAEITEASLPTISLIASLN